MRRESCTMSSSSACFVCRKSTDGAASFGPQFSVVSKTPLFTLLEQMLGYSLSAELTDFDYVCSSCVVRFNEYDEAFHTAKRVESELLELFGVRSVLSVKEEISYETYIEEEYEEKEPSKCESFEQKELPKCELFAMEESQTICVMKVTNEANETNEKELKFDKKTETIKRKHERQPTPQLCKGCNVKFLSTPDLKEHVCNSMEKQFICDICGHRYKSKSALSIHMSLHNGKNAHHCTVCGKKFTQRGALRRHMPIHTGEKPYQCDICGKQFIHYSSFHMHKLAHDDVRKQQCSICGLELRSTSHLARHMRVHSGEKPHECPKCGQKFAQRYNMTAHFKAHQGIHRAIAKNHKCSICMAEFAKPCQLRDHILNKHNALSPSTESGEFKAEPV